MKAEPPNSLEEAEAWLGGLINLERTPSNRAIRMGLDAIRALCERIGNPQSELSVLHVAGSKGKGSVCFFAEAILRELGDSVGTFTSPHLERWTERFRVDGREIEGAVLAAAIERLHPHVEALRNDPRGPAPSFFDATTAAAFLIFAEQRVDRAVLEVGLGGRLDSTNVVEPLTTCITTIELEHTDRLGNTLGKIAGEKAGIMKPAVPCVVGRLAPEAMQVVEARASELDAPLARLDREIQVEALPADTRANAAPSSHRFVMRDEAGFELEAELPIVGEHQLANAALAVACVRRLGPHSDVRVARAARVALANCEQPGRCEVLRSEPWVVVDSAHTEASAGALARALAGFPPARVRFVLSVSGGKALDAILSALLPLAARVVATRVDPHRSMDPQALAEAIEKRAPGLPVVVCEDPEQAIREEATDLARHELLCVAGSVYLAGVGRRVLIPRSGL